MAIDFERILIIGGPGSGKSDLADYLAALTQAPLVRLDEIAFHDASPGSFKDPSDRGRRLKMVDGYSQQQRWVAEGVYFSWLGKSFREAQHIVVLMTPMHVRAHRIRERIYALPEPSRCHEQLSHLLAKNQEYDELFTSRIAGFLKPFEDKIRIFNGPGKARKHFKRLLNL
jgi:adenylate kinase family enzyme